MPFTLAHPLAVLPFKKVSRKYVSMTALVIGSMAPDLEYFLLFSPTSIVSHTVSGIFIFNLPITVLFTYLWCSLIRENVLAYIPFAGKRYSLTPAITFSNLVLKQPVVFLLSATVGIFTHLLWDSFTHIKGTFVEGNEFLTSTVYLAGTKVRWCYVLWYISSVVGLIYLSVYFLYKKKSAADPGIKFNRYAINIFWSKVIFFTILLSVIRIGAGLSWKVERHLVIIVIGAFIYALVAICVSMKRVESVE